MTEIKVLDCTLRDGGYCNEWRFKDKNKRKIIQGLNNAGVDIIECGFLTNKTVYDEDSTRFNIVTQVDNYIADIDATCVVMINCGEYDIEKLPNCGNTKIKGIRLAFHKKDIESAINISKTIISKGYKLFVQPMLSLAYSKQEFINLCTTFNNIQPFAFYIVDSFGSMTLKQLDFYFEIANVIMDENIWIGFHSHNNMQLAYSNAQMLVEKNIERKLIIDASIMGMGRGAGNLNTELFLEFLKQRYNMSYNIVPVLNIVDTILNGFYHEKAWGYSLENYLSAKHNSHPSYASFLSEKNSLNFEEMNEIFKMMVDDKRLQFDIEYAKVLYAKYMERNRSRFEHVSSVIDVLNGRNILLIAPGKSAKVYKKETLDYIKEKKPIIIDINVMNLEYDVDYIFVSNIRRYKELDKNINVKLIITSNIESSKAYKVVDYDKLKNNNEFVFDNAGLMAIKLCLLSDALEIMIVGMDGYELAEENYMDDSMRMSMSREEMRKLNIGMREELKLFLKSGKIKFVNSPKFMEEIR